MNLTPLLFRPAIFVSPVAYLGSQEARTVALWEAFFTGSLFLVAVYLVYLLLALLATHPRYATPHLFRESIVKGPATCYTG